MRTFTNIPATILLVDDTDSVRASLARMLRAEGYLVEEAPHGPAALTYAQSHASAISLVLCDMRMPGLDGPATVERLRAIRRDLAVIFISGDFSDEEAWDPARDPGVPARLRKPIEREDLLEAVRRALATRGDGGSPR